MRGLGRFVIVGLLAAMVSGCAVLSEYNNEGGYAATAADHFIKATGKKKRLLRAYLVQAALIRLTTYSAMPNGNRDSFVGYITSANKRFDEAYACAFRGDIENAKFKTNYDKIRGSDGCFYFDSIMIDYENILFEMAMFDLTASDRSDLWSLYSGTTSSILFVDQPARKLKSFIGSTIGTLGTSIATVDPFSVIDTLLDYSRKAYVAERPFGAVYRDMKEYVRIYNNHRNEDHANQDAKTISAACNNFYCELSGEPQPTDFAEIYEMTRFFCRHIGLTSSTKVDQCREVPANIALIYSDSPKSPKADAREKFNVLPYSKIAEGLISVDGQRSAPKDEEDQ